MAPQNLTEYERKRLENIRRNEEIMAALKIHSKANELSVASKRQRVGTKTYSVSSEKKDKTQNPIVIRKSLRTRGQLLSNSEGVKDDLVDSGVETSLSPEDTSPRHMGPISMRDAYKGTGSDEKLIETILGVSKRSQLGTSVGGEVSGVDVMSDTKVQNSVDLMSIRNSVDLMSMSLELDNIARVVPGRITTVRFFPCPNSGVIVAGNKFGDVGFWDVDCANEEENQIYPYHPHTAPISGILIPQYSLTKIFTSCYDGYIRLMDIEKEIFDLIYSSDETIYSISQRTDDTKCLYFGEGHGGLNVWDERTGKSSTSWVLHEDRINSIDFNSENPYIMATSSSDGSACIWDLRSIDADKPKSLKTISHKRAVHSAFFSPSGTCLATTSIDDTVGILKGANFEETFKIRHDNKTGRWISSFRGIWGWDDSYIFIGNMKRGVDVISAHQRKTVMTLQSPHISAIPCRFDAHPYRIGMLAGATSGGQVYIWT